MNEIVPKGKPCPKAGEAEMVARELGASYRSRVDYLKRREGMAPAEAAAKAGEPAPLGRQFAVMDCPAEEVTWSGLEDLARSSPEKALLRWEEVKEAARQELRSGERAAKASQGYGCDAWERARFLALRDELGSEWQPRNGFERQLIDNMAQAQTAAFFWQERLAQRATAEAMREGREVDQRGGWDAPRVTECQAIEQAAGMVDRFGRIFVRYLRSLRDLRRHCPSVVVQNAGQVNVGGQQVNVAGG